MPWGREGNRVVSDKQVKNMLQFHLHAGGIVGFGDLYSRLKMPVVPLSTQGEALCQTYKASYVSSLHRDTSAHTVVRRCSCRHHLVMTLFMHKTPPWYPGSFVQPTKLFSRNSGVLQWFGHCFSVMCRTFHNCVTGRNPTGAPPDIMEDTAALAGVSSVEFP